MIPLNTVNYWIDDVFFCTATVVCVGGHFSEMGPFSTCLDIVTKRKKSPSIIYICIYVKISYNNSDLDRDMLAWTGILANMYPQLWYSGTHPLKFVLSCGTVPRRCWKRKTSEWGYYRCNACYAAGARRDSRTSWRSGRPRGRMSSST